MVNEKQKILFIQEQETLLIPLYSKAIESRQPDPIFFDQKTLDSLDQIDYDFTRLKVARKTTIMVCMRASKLDDYAKAF
jgi:O-methyltransferase involved in polyketide biosynthesis